MASADGGQEAEHGIAASKANGNGVVAEAVTPTQHGAAVAAGPRHDEVYCVTCGGYTHFMRARQLSKMKMTWRCSICDTQINAIYRKHGRGGISSIMQNIDEVRRQEFFRSLHGMSEGDIAVTCNRLFDEFTYQEDFYEEGGSFLPLGVWERKGYDAKAIEAKTLPCDVQDHPVLGTCYRVKLRTQAKRNSTGTRETGTSSSAAGSFSAQALGRGLSGDDARAPLDGTDPDKSSTSSSTSSSSSSDKKKKRKHKDNRDKKTKKHNKKDKKQDKKNKIEKNDKAERARCEKEQKALDADRAKQVRSATDVIAKMSGPKAALDTAIANRLFAETPNAIKEQAKSCGEAMALMESDAAACIAGPGGSQLNFTLKDALKLIVQSKKVENMLQQVFKAIIRGQLA